MSFRPDVLVVIEYRLNEPDRSVIRTNARPERLEEIISAWVQDQIGRGKDAREPARREVYTIKIGLRVADDAFGTESDTGNAGLTCGLVMDVLPRLDRLLVVDL